MVLARLVLVAATGSLALGACYRDRAPGGPLEHRAERARTAAASGDALAFLPIDSEIVLGLDARQIFASPLWKRFEPQLLGLLGKDLPDFQARCGYDPFAELRGVTIGAKAGDPLDGVLVVRGLPRDKTMACIGRALPQRARITVEGGIITVPGDGDDPPAVMSFAGQATLVIATSRAKLDAALAAGAPLRKSRAFSELWALIDARHAVWAIVNGSARAFDSLSALGIRPRAILGSVALGSGLSLTGLMRFGTADEATQLASLGQSQVGAAKGMVDHVEIGTDGPDVTLRVDMTVAQLESLAGMMLGLAGWGSPLGGP
jgi:hypothetical protein